MVADECNNIDKGEVSVVTIITLCTGNAELSYSDTCYYYVQVIFCT